MKWAALIVWLLTASAGLVMLSLWVANGGLRGRRAHGIRPPVIFGHFLLALSGLVVWLVYVATGTSTFAWVAFVVLVVVAMPGAAMFGEWQKRPAPVAEARQFPRSVVGLHGLLATTTVLLVFLTAVGIG